MTTTPTGWTGWIRVPGEKPWRSVCTAATRGQCWERLLEIDKGRNSDRMVLRAGTVPTMRHGKVHLRLLRETP